jgi:hypothetical protein
MSEEPEYDIDKQLAHWRNGADEAWEAAVDMINKDRRHPVWVVLCSPCS